MRIPCLLVFLAVTNAKLQPKNVIPHSCATNNNFYWNTLAAHFADATLVTINILHVEKYHNTMAGFVDVVLRNVHVFIKLQKSVCVKHTDLSHGEKKRAPLLAKGAHLVIVWDDEILSDFLDFVPEKIVADRHGKYLILFAHDIAHVCFKFAELVLARFWKEFGIINVCANVPCSCNSNIIYQNHPFLRKINAFNFSELQNHPISTKDLKQYPLRVSMFQRLPTAIEVKNDPIIKVLNKKPPKPELLYSGVDGFMMGTLSQVLNFRIIYQKTDYYEYGKFLANGTAVGSLGDVVYRRVHIAGNGRFMEYYDGGRVEFSLPYQNDYVCFVVPKSQKVPRWIMLFHCFAIESWLAFFTVFTLAAILWKALGGKFLIFYSIFINSPTTFNQLTQKQKLFLIFCLSYNLIILGVFQGSFTTSFSTISYYPDITTLEALAESGLKITSNVEVFKNDNNTLATTLKNRQQPTNGDWALKRAALKRDVAGIERRLDAIYHIQKLFLDENGSPLVHIVDECVTSHFIAFIVPKDSPFLEQFNLVIARLTECGFALKWYRDITGSEILKSRSITLRSGDEKKALVLSDVQAAFYILLMGLGVASCVFLLELWKNERRMPLQYLP